MNSEVYRLNKASKKRSRIEQLLLVDHSDIYFENDKLGDRLNRYLLQLRKEHHKSVILRDNEIKELNKELENFQAILNTSELGRKLREEAEQSETVDEQTLNSDGELDSQINLKRRLRALTPDLDFKYSKEKQHKVRIKSSLEIFPEEPLIIPKSRTPSPEGNPDEEQKEEKRPNLGQRSLTYTSGFKRHRKVKERIDTSDFPQEWFTTVVPASDAVLARARRHKSAPLHQQLRMLRTKKTKNLKEDDSDNENKDDSNEKEENEEKGLKVICDTPVKPVVMSLRQLKEIANIDNLAEKVPNKYEIVLQERKEKAKIQFGKLETRCKEFVEDIKRKTEQDIESATKVNTNNASGNDIFT